jgi:hypothetical protein
MKPEVLDALQPSVEAGYANTDWCKQDPDLQILNDEPELQKILRAGADHANAPDFE